MKIVRVMSHGCEYIFKSMKFYTNVNALAILFNLYIRKLECLG